jgi:hypothetical protein
MCRERLALRRMAFSAGFSTGSLHLHMTPTANARWPSGDHPSRFASHRGSLYLSLGRLLIRL